MDPHWSPARRDIHCGQDKFREAQRALQSIQKLGGQRLSADQGPQGFRRLDPREATKGWCQICGFSWIFWWIFNDFHRFLWIFMDFLVDVQRFSWFFVDFHGFFGGFSTIFIDFCGCSWIFWWMFNDFRRFLWIFMDFLFRRFLWIFTNHHSRKSTGFLQESLLPSNKWVALQYTIWLFYIAMEKPW